MSRFSPHSGPHSPLKVTRIEAFIVAIKGRIKMNIVAFLNQITVLI